MSVCLTRRVRIWLFAQSPRALLGVKYCPSRKCQNPLHGCRKGNVSRGVNLKMSKEIKETWDVLVPVSSGERDHCM